MTDKTDPRVEILARTMFQALYIYKWPDKASNPDMWRAKARKVLAEFDAARPVETQLTPETAPTMADMQRMTDDLLTDPAAMDAYMAANPLPVEPPADEEVAGLIERLHEAQGWVALNTHFLEGLSSSLFGDAANLIERQQVEIARLTADKDQIVSDAKRMLVARRQSRALLDAIKEDRT